MNVKQIKQALTTPTAVVLVLSAVALALALLLVAPASQPEANKVVQAAQESDDEEAARETNGEEADPSEGVVYEYSAQPGDSYSKIARKAVQTYGLKHEVNLSGAQIVYAETNLTLEAGSPLLNVGQEVAVDESAVKAWVEKAQDLSDDQKAAWQPYTVGVNFNTDNIGESR